MTTRPSPAPPTRTPGALPVLLAVAALVAALAAWRLLIAWILPATQDEAYYFDWARTLAWGYFDHPPGVALLGLGTRLDPGSALVARLGNLLAGTLTLIALARLYYRSGLTRAADIGLALVLAATTLPGLVGGIVATPDSPLALAWALALHESERALAGDRRRWLTVGIAVGLGLLGKYTMAAIGPVLLWGILRADPRALRTPWPYLGALLALLVFAPNLIWNAQHDWLTLRFQFGHGFALETGDLLAGAGSIPIEQAAPQSFGERAGNLLGYLGTQLGFWGMLAPLLLALPWIARARIARATGPEAREPSRLLPHARPLLNAAALFPLGFFALVSTVSSVEANWPAMYLLAAPAVLAPWLRQAYRWILAAAAGNVILASLYAVHAATGALPLPDSANRILRETHGFRELSAIAAELDAPVHADRYQLAAMLRFYEPTLQASQWPGIARPSEYLRGIIAPRVGPETQSGPFWLLTRLGQAPAISGFAAGAQRTLYDCAGQPLAERAAAPCGKPLHRWYLYRYAPIGGPFAPSAAQTKTGCLVSQAARLRFLASPQGFEPWLPP